MISNLRNILVCLTEQLGTEASSDALGYGLSLAEQAGARVTVQVTCPHAVVRVQS